MAKNDPPKKTRKKKTRRKKSEAWGRLGFCIAGNRIALLIDKGLEHRGSKGLRGTVLSLVATGDVTGMDVTTCA